MTRRELLSALLSAEDGCAPSEHRYEEHEEVLGLADSYRAFCALRGEYRSDDAAMVRAERLLSALRREGVEV